MAACDKCGARKLKKRRKGHFAGFYWCKMHGPVGPRPVIEAAVLGIPVSLRNEILRRQLAEDARTRDAQVAIQTEMIAAYRAANPTITITPPDYDFEEEAL